MTKEQENKVWDFVTLDWQEFLQEEWEHPLLYTAREICEIDLAQKAFLAGVRTGLRCMEFRGKILSAPDYEP
jgi:hypothetical protein